MAGSTRVLGWVCALSSAARVAGLGFAVGLCITASCTLPAQGPSSVPVDGAGGSISIGNEPPGFGGVGAGDLPCMPSVTATPVFGDQVFSSNVLFSRELYTWTTDEQALALRKDKALFTQPPSGAALPLLRSFAYPDSLAQLAQALSGEFQLGRYAWPEPWPMRMGSAGEDPGGQLVRILLKPEAWLAIVEQTGISVFDAERKPVAPADAVAHPERIGVIYSDSTFINNCGNTAQGQRVFLLGNLAMVQEWSLGTQQIADRLNANISELTRFLTASRSCPVTTDASSWAGSVLCAWSDQLLSNGEAGASGSDPGPGPIPLRAFAGGPGAGGAAQAPAGPQGTGGPAQGAGGAAASGGVGFSVAGGFGIGEAGSIGVGSATPLGFNAADFGGLRGLQTEEFAYDQALAVPSPSYLAAPAQIATIIETLQGDLFEPDPLVVTPGSP